MQKLKLMMLTAFFSLAVIGNAQNKVTESALIGTWKMTINSEEVMKEIKKESDEEDNLFAKVILSSVGGMVDGILRNIDVYIKFERNGDAKIIINAFEDNTDEDDSEWYIKSGKLYINDTKKGDNIDWDSDDHWEMRDGILYLESDDSNIEVYMVKMDK